MFDDRIHILENDAVISFRSVFDSESLQRIRGHEFGLLARPLLFLTYGINYASSGSDPAAFRLTNLLIHATNSLLVLWIVLELSSATEFRKRDRFRIAWIAGALFATHPLLTESVTYIAGRSSSLCATFYFAGLLAAIRAGRMEARRRIALVALALAFTGIAWLVKQDTVVLPLAMIAIFWMTWPDKTSYRDRTMATTACVLFLAFALILNNRSITAVQSISQSNQALVSAGFDQTIALKPYVLTSIEQLTMYYLWRMFVPIRLNVDPEPAIISSPLAVGFLFSAVVVVGLAGMALWFWKRDRLLASGIALMLISPLAPYCFFPLADIVAEHRAYITVLGAVIVMAVCIMKLRESLLVAAVIVLGYAWMTADRNTVWKDEALLWENASAQAPNKVRPRLNLGAIYQTRGRTDDAMREYQFVLSRNPQHSTALSNLGSLFLASNDLQSAEDLLSRAIAGGSTLATVYLNLAVVRLRQARFPEARELLERARDLSPRQLLVHHNLGDILFNERHFDQAMSEYLTELQLNPNSAITHLHLAKAYEATGASSSAREHYLFLQKIDPNNQEVQAALQRLK